MKVELTKQEIEILLAMARQVTLPDDTAALVLAQVRIKLALALGDGAGAD